MTLAHALDIAYAGAMPPGNAGGPAALFNMALPFIAMAAIAYFMMLRPQQRQKADRERMLSALKRGDRVVTTSGLHGTVVGLNEQTVTLKVADQVRLDFDRTALGRIVRPTADKESGS